MLPLAIRQHCRRPNRGVLTGALLAFHCLWCCAPTDAQTNVVLLMSDDQGWGDVGYNGHPHLQTPHLDAMARDGLTLTRFYAQAPVCSPTRGSVLTGRHPYRYGIPFANSGHMKAEELTLAELLKKHGYTTGHFGKWHLGTLTKTVRESNRGGPKGAADYAPPWDNGFDANFSTEAKVPTWDPMWIPQDVKRKTWWDPLTDDANGKHYGTHYWSRGKMVTDNLRGDDSRVIMDRAIPFIKSAVQQDRPFFTVIWFHAPHLPVVAGPKYTRLYRQFDKHKQHYLGCITALDEQIGRLRAELKALGVERNTLLCFCADNGPEGNAKAPGSAGNLRGRKRSLYEGGIRVPGLMVWPARIRPGTVTNVPCCTSDYLPTLASLVGAAPISDWPIDGVDLLPLIDGKMTARPQGMGFESRNQVAWIENRFKIIHVGKQNERSQTLKFELYDLSNDPAESRDLAAEKPRLVTEMAARVEAWRESCQRSAAGADYSKN